MAAVVLATSSGLGVSVLAQPAAAVLAPGSICHASDSNTNPYIVNAPASDGQAGGHASHTGEPWSFQQPKLKEWGDIIPPFEYLEGGVVKQFPGLNWTALGPDVWAADCEAVYPDLVIDKQASGDGTEGGSGWYTLDVSNTGDARALAPVVVKDTLPAGVTVTSIEPGTGWSCGQVLSVITCTRATDLLKGAVASTIKVNVTWGAPSSTVLNKAEVVPAVGEKDLTDNKDEVTTKVTGPQLSATVVKTVDADGDGTYADDETAAAPQDDVEVRVVVTNTSGVAATLHSVTDAYPGAAAVAMSCLPALPTVLAHQGTATCALTLTDYAPARGGSVVNTATATLTRVGSTAINPTATATTRTHGAPTFTVVKTNDGDGDGTYGAAETVTAPGTDVPFKVTVTNTSPYAIEVASVHDAIGAAPGVLVTCQPALNALAPGASADCLFTLDDYSPADGGTTTNTVTVRARQVGNTGNGASVTSGTSSVTTVVPPRPSFTVTKTNDADGDGTFSAAETATSVGKDVPFRATITNTSPYAITVTSVVDSVDGAPGVAVSCTPLLGQLAPTASVDCLFTMAAYSPPHGDAKDNTVTVTAAQVGNSGNTAPVTSGSSRVTTQLRPTFTVGKANDADGDTTFTADETATSEGAPVPFRVTVTNTSGFPITVSQVQDTVGLGAPATVTCLPAILSLAPAATATCGFTMTGYTPAHGSTTSNTVSVTATESGVPGNSASAGSAASTVTTRIPPTLTLVKTNDASGDGTFNVAETATSSGAAVPFRVTVTNTSGYAIDVTGVQDTVGTDPATTVACTPAIIALPAGQSASCGFSMPGYSPAHGASTSNTVTVSIAETADASNRGAGTSPASTVRTRIAPSFTVVKANDADGDGTFGVAETATSVGKDVPFRVRITNTSPYGLTVTGISDAVNGAAGTAVTCAPALSALAAGASADCRFTMPAYSPADGLTKDNVVTVAAVDSGDATNSKVVSSAPSSVTTGVPAPTFTVLKTNDADGDGTFTADEAATTVGAAVPFRVTVTNTSAYPIDVVSVTDTVTGGVPSVVACVPAILGLAPGASASCDFVLSGYAPQAGSVKSNTVSVAAAQTGAPAKGATSTSRASSVTTTVPLVPDLALLKSGPASRTTGGTGDYALTVSNVGTGPATARITVVDTLPAGVLVAPATSTGFACTATGQFVTCTTEDDLAAGASRTIVLPATFTSAGSKTNTATVTVAGDTNAANDTGTATTQVTDPPVVPPVDPPVDPPVQPLPADLSLDKSGPASVLPGGTLTWRLAVLNKGPGTAAGFTVTDTLPAAVDLVSLSGTGFTCSVPALTCTHAGSLAAGATAVVEVVGTLRADSVVPSITNVALVGPTDATPADNTDTLATSVLQPAPGPGQADLVLDKAGPADAVSAGDEVAWGIAVTNVGTAAAQGFVVQDVLAAGSTLVSASGDGFACTGTAEVLCTFAGELAPGATARLTVVITLAADYAGSAVANTAVVPLAGDPTPGNNSDTATTAVVLPIDGVTEEPATEQPEPTPTPTPEPVAVGGTTEQPATRPDALPFTGARADLGLGLGAGLSVLGLLLALLGRRRRVV